QGLPGSDRDSRAATTTRLVRERERPLAGLRLARVQLQAHLLSTRLLPGRGRGRDLHDLHTALGLEERRETLAERFRQRDAQLERLRLDRNRGRLDDGDALALTDVGCRFLRDGDRRQEEHGRERQTVRE